MSIIIKNKETLIFDEFVFKCCIGKKGFTKNKVEGDLKTPVGNFNLGNLYFRSDRKKKPLTNLKLIKISNKMGWCNDIKSEKNYNKPINTDTFMSFRRQ